MLPNYRGSSSNCPLWHLCVICVSLQPRNNLHKKKPKVRTNMSNGGKYIKLSVEVKNVVQNNYETSDAVASNKRQKLDENYEIVRRALEVEAAGDIVEKKNFSKRKNFVIMLGYRGRDYFGMQINRGTKTIEESLLSALLKANFITKDQFEDVRLLRFQRAARTDKGVSAVRQIVSLLLPQEVNKEDVNKHLPNDIRVFDIQRVIKTFNKDQNFLKLDIDDEIDEEQRLKDLSVINGKPYKEFRLTPEMLDKLNNVLKLFEGTHNFHNFTSKIRPLDPSARRYIIHFRCIETFVANNMEFAVLEVKGQSFMLHQIRKMVSLVIGICRNIVSSDFVKDVFSLEKYDIPIAPGLGLSLHFVHYSYYNKRYGKDGIHKTLEWQDCNEEVEKFYKEYILQDIIDTETLNNVMLNWLAIYLTPKRFASKEFVACEDIE
ncbi:tRNA pseudouridine synthase A, mitochondrial [Melipona quadrifasciata]|uniref:Pseudouridylate synthase 1 homolog n=1 Tax=Melipona quadrifasciata TaxID=166423 RepID=A0A0N0BHH8_9HYME|nr:tRNA pseudouridine synthase A, mitochondrial [Melipona quadrifasciata]